MLNLNTLVENATIDFKERLQDQSESTEVGDIIHQVADANVPVVYNDLIDVAYHDRFLIMEEPKLWPAFDGTNNPINLIASNLYEYLCEQLREVTNEIENTKAE